MSIRRFQDQPIWQMSHELTKEVSSITRKFPRSDPENLAHQMNQSSIELYSKITELFDKNSCRKTSRDLTHSYNSLHDLKRCYKKSLDLRYISQNRLIEDVIIELEVQINYLMESKTA